MPVIHAESSNSELRCWLTDVPDVGIHQYAFYLEKDSISIEKKWYSNELNTKFVLHSNGVYRVTAFIKNEHGDITIIHSKPLRFMKGMKPDSIPFLEIRAIEVTNYCNLSCEYCPSSIGRYHKGFIDDQTMLQALSWTRKGQIVSFHMQGEPLLHNDLEKYVRWGVESGILPTISTNGILLNNDRLASLWNSGLCRFLFTLHTPESVESFVKTYNWFVQHGIEILPTHSNREYYAANSDKPRVFITGKIIGEGSTDTRTEEVKELFSTIPKKAKQLIKHYPFITWLGNVSNAPLRDITLEEIKYNQDNCYFIQKGIVIMRWDGTVIGCCFDSENENEIGHIRDFANVRIDLKKYLACRHCIEGCVVPD